MAIYPDGYQKFLCGIPTDICERIFEYGLSPEVNSIDDLVACAKAVEISQKMAEYYQKKSLPDSSSVTRMNTLRQITPVSKPRVTTAYPCHMQFVTKPLEECHEEKCEEVAPHQSYRSNGEP